MIGLCSFENNQGKIYTEIANIYYKKNNFNKATYFYEKAFDINYNNKTAREIYINLLINSPLSLENQKKLINFLKIQIDDLAKIKAYNYINSIKNEINKKYPDNYIAQTVYNQQVLRWGKNPIKYKIVKNEDTPEYFVDEVKNAFSTWEKACNYQILFLESNDDENIIINFKSKNPAGMKENKFIVAYTYPTINTNILEKMNIDFYLKNPNGELYSTNQIYNTALHEIVHAMGFMGHSSDKKNVMYISKDRQIVEDDKRIELTQADISTIKLLYKIQADITNINEIKPDYLPEFILGTKEEILKAKIQEARTYIKKAPELPAGYVDLAEGYIQKNEQKKALKLLEKALNTSESEEIKGMIYYNLAVVYYQIANYDTASFYLDKSFEIKDNEEKHHLAAEIHKANKNFKSAEKEYTYLISKKPNNIEYTIALTNFYIENKKYFKAIKTLKQFIKNNPREKNNPRFKPYGILNIFI